MSRMKGHGLKLVANGAAPPIPRHSKVLTGALDAVTDLCDHSNGPMGIDLEVYLAGINAGLTHGEALVLAQEGDRPLLVANVDLPLM